MSHSESLYWNPLQLLRQRISFFLHPDHHLLEILHPRLGTLPLEPKHQPLANDRCGLKGRVGAGKLPKLNAAQMSGAPPVSNHPCQPLSTPFQTPCQPPLEPPPSQPSWFPLGTCLWNFSRQNRDRISAGNIYGKQTHTCFTSQEPSDLRVVDGVSPSPCGCRANSTTMMRQPSQLQTTA